MAQTKIRRSTRRQFAAEKITDLAVKVAPLVDAVLSSEAHTRAGDDARRMLRVTLKQLEMVAESSNDPLLVAAIYDCNERFRESCPGLIE